MTVYRCDGTPVYRCTGTVLAVSPERQIVAAYRAGQASWDEPLSEQPVANPWNGRAETARERVLSVVWRRGRLSRIDPVFRAETA